MNRTETTQILATLKAAYPHSFRDLTKRDAEVMIELWTRMFSAESYAEVSTAVAALIATRTVGFSPTIGEVKEQIQHLRASCGLSETDAWALVAKACRNGYYGYRDEFAKLPPEVQAAVGSAEQLREWSIMDSDAFQSVVASNFMRGFRTRARREKELAMLPPDIRALIGAVADTLKLPEKTEKENENEQV